MIGKLDQHEQRMDDPFLVEPQQGPLMEELRWCLKALAVNSMLSYNLSPTFYQCFRSAYYRLLHHGFTRESLHKTQQELKRVLLITEKEYASLRNRHLESGRNLYDTQIDSARTAFDLVRQMLATLPE